MKRNVISVCLLLSLTVCACGQQQATDYSKWITVDKSQNLLQDSETKIESDVQKTTDSKCAITTYSAEELMDALLSDNSELLADMMWQNQISYGVYSVTEEEITKNTLTYYISSSEGNDENFGLSPASPKRTMSGLSGMSNITILLKCGDVFEMPSSFTAGSNCIYATYGQGKRPVVSYYLDLDLIFTKTVGCENVWQANLSEFAEIYTGQLNKDNCNIGQLLVDGETNWKRIVVSTAESSTYDFAKGVEEKGNGCWSVDWLNSILYIYSKDDPSQHKIQVAPDVHGVVFDNVHDTVLKGWEITGVGAHGINLTSARNVIISSCYLKSIGGSVHRAAGIRYGNGIQVWDGGTNATIANNYSDWVFDSCYTDQGSSDNAICSGVRFINNVGAHSFTGIETWGNCFSEGKYEKVEYSGNILYSMCDITDPDQRLYASESGGLIPEESEEDNPYVSFRGGYTYNQMACLNVVVSLPSEVLSIHDNVFWKTNRLLMLANGDSGQNMSNVKDNLFYAEISTPLACLFRYKSEGDICYASTMVDKNNTESVHVLGDEHNNITEYQRLKGTLMNTTTQLP